MWSPEITPHPSFAFGKTHLPPRGKACKGDKNAICDGVGAATCRPHGNK